MNDHKSSLTNIRATAGTIIHAVAVGGQSLQNLLADTDLNRADQALLQEMVYGVCRWYFSLEQLHDRWLNRPLNRKDRIAAALLKTGAYQLLFMRIPPHAAINETVGAADELDIPYLKGLINAVLHKIEQMPDDEKILDAATSHPEWMREKLRHNWPEHFATILQENNRRPPMTLRTNCRKANREDYLQLLEQAGIEATAGNLSPHAVVLNQPCDVKRLPGFSEGQVSVQDEAAQLCAALMDLAPGQRVLDACAAPGGKTGSLLEQEPDLKLSALEIDAQRSKRISENLDRLKLKATVQNGSALSPESWWDGTRFDRILLDAPCSASGVIRRHPDIKLLRRQEDIKALAANQLAMLEALWPTLETGGMLLYATCSVFPQENSRIIERFLKRTPDAHLVTLNVDWGLDTGFGHQLLPQERGPDGFFYARLRKQAN